MSDETLTPISPAQRLVPSAEQMRPIEAALGAGDGRRAALLADALVTQGYEHPNLLTLAAHHQIGLGAPALAHAYAERAHRMAPNSIEALNAVGQSLTQLVRHPEAVLAYDAAITLAPDVPMLHFSRAMALDEMGSLALARDAYERTIALKPAFTAAHARLAHIAARQGDTKKAREHALSALAGDPDEAVASFALASVELEEKNYDAAEARLRALTARHPAIATSMLGDVLDARGRFPEAFRAYETAGRLQDEQYAHIFAAGRMETALNWVKGRTEYFFVRPQGFARDMGAPVKAPVRTHAFLVGFPRSGTTLLESVLGAHPAIEAMDERDCLNDAVMAFGKNRETLDRLAALSTTDLEPYRAAYWRAVKKAGFALERDVFVDKMPLNSIQLCLIAKLFPEAKILFALRDPRDVVLSCFRRRFGMTIQMYELNTLESAAKYYDAVMTLVELYRAQLGLDILDVRYEDLVADFEKETRRLCDFLSVPWTEGMENFVAGASARVIDTPSAVQLARGLFGEGAGQWRNYRDEMAPVLPLLAKWVARFGYPEN